jgi:hypothetical protein
MDFLRNSRIGVLQNGLQYEAHCLRPGAEGWRGRDYGIVAHSGLRRDPCNSCRGGGFYKTEPQSCERSPSLPSCPHGRTAGDRMLRAPYRSAAPPLWLPTSAACPTGRSPCARGHHLAARDFVTWCQAQPGREGLALGHALRSVPHSPRASRPTMDPTHGSRSDQRRARRSAKRPR